MSSIRGTKSTWTEHWERGSSQIQSFSLASSHRIMGGDSRGQTDLTTRGVEEAVSLAVTLMRLSLREWALLVIRALMKQQRIRKWNIITGTKNSVKLIISKEGGRLVLQQSVQQQVSCSLMKYRMGLARDQIHMERDRRNASSRYLLVWERTSLKIWPWESLERMLWKW